MKTFALLLLLISIQLFAAEENKTICLNMIVKNESAVIRRCLDSVKPIIDYWVISDTGSTDGTQQIIKEHMKDIPGELHECPWQNFEYNRNEALKAAKGKGDYLLFIDADEVLVYENNFSLPPLDKDFYFILTHFGGTHYQRVQLINNHLDWKWTGVLHEAVDSPQAITSDLLPRVYNLVSSDGSRSQDPQKYQKDAQILEKALQQEPNNRRYQFYLAQSYRDAGEHALAMQNYLKRIAMGGWDQEVFWSMLQVALMQEQLQMPPEIITSSYQRAFAYRPSRAEPLYRLANYYRRQENYQAGYEVAKKGLAIPLSHDSLFVESGSTTMGF